MEQLTLNDLPALAIGAAVLGSGGGGDPAYSLLMAQQALEDFGPIRLINLNEIAEPALVAPVCYMGAPLVSIEKIPSGQEFLSILEAISKIKGQYPTHLCAGEIGGGNALTPVIVAAQTGLPIVDADLVGRAFPELQMASANLCGVSPAPTFLSDAMGNVEVLYESDCLATEKMCREITIDMGSSAALSIYLMDANQAIKATIEGSLSRAIQIGQKILRKEDFGGINIGSGMITDINQRIEDGFLKGDLTIHSENQTFTIIYQNEYLDVRSNGKRIACSPDIIAILEEETGLPISSESITYGLRVQIAVLTSPPLWLTPEGMELVGPKYFGLEE